MKNLNQTARRCPVVLLLLFILLAGGACRDRDTLLAPETGPLGAVRLAVYFESSEDSLDAGAEGEEKGADSKVKNGSPRTLLAQSSSITSMRADVYDESGGRGSLLNSCSLVLDRAEGTFSGELEVQAGEDRIVAVTAYTSVGVGWLGLSRRIRVPAGGTAEAAVEVKSFVPVILDCDPVSLTGDFTIQWQSVPHATGFIVYESVRNDFAAFDSVLVPGSRTYISFSGRPRGVRYIRLRSSSDYALGALSATVSVTVTSAPEVAIISPTDGSSVGTGVPVLFLARAMDSEEGALAGNSVAWSSSLDGNFAAGAFVLYDRLSRGTHLIAITARNSTGGMASDTVSLTVEDGGNRAPLLTVTAPGDGSSFNRSQQVLFLATGTDPEDGPLPEDRFYWLSDADGLFGSGPALECNGLGLGGHVIVVVGADEAGAAGADSISLDIVASGANTPPEATIITPVDGTEFAAGTAVLLQGSATDAEQGGLIGAEGLSWSSSLDGELGDGAAWLAEGLSTGVHRIFLTALDAQGAAGRDSVAVSFTASGGNRAPEVRIVSPPDSSAFALGQTVAFQAEVSDPEEGALEDTAIRWSSDIGGSLGEGAGFATDRLSGGVHRITLLAVDSRGAAGRDSVRVGISGPPEVSISSPVHGESYPIGAPLEFTGSAIDPEEGALGPEALTWWYSPLGESRQIGEGNSFVTRELGFGVHRITLIAEDGMGVKDSASVTISMVSMPDSVLASISVGSRPLHVALDNTGGTAYVTNSGGSSVSVVSLETFQETNRIGVGENPAGVGFSPGMARVYVANSSENNISVIRDNSVEQTIPVGFQPSGVAVGPDETMVFVANSNAASLSVVGAAEGTVVRTISDVGNSPGSMLIPPGARELLFVSNYGSREQGESGRDEVAAVQWTASSITRIPVGDKPLGLAATSDGALVFVANSGSGSVSVIDADALSVVSEIAVGLNPSSCAVTPDNNQLYVVNSGSRSISVIDIQSKVIIETVGEFGLDPYDIAVYEAPEAEPRVLMLVTDRGADRLKVLLVR